MSAQEPQKRRRIVPQQIQASPVQGRREVTASDKEEACPRPRDLKQQAQLGHDLLGPARKIFVELGSTPGGYTSINWKEVCGATHSESDAVPRVWV